MSQIIDFHAHVFPDRLGHMMPTRTLGAFHGLRKKVREWYRPVSGSFHKVQTLLRYLPSPVRKGLDELSGLAPLPGLIFESTPGDLLEGMNDSQINGAMVIAHPPMIPNEFVLEMAQDHPDRFYPVVFIPSGTSRPGQALKRLAQHGAKALKIHPAADGEGVDSPRYRALLRAAADLGLPVILHTGCMNAHVFYRDPDQGRAERFAPWFENYKSLRFILAHMNYHQPQVALDLMEEHPNVYTDTSWQPAELIGEAVRRVGAKRILFGTDWPFVGNNFKICMSRIQDNVETGTITEEESRWILGENAAELLGLNTRDPIHAD